MLDPRWHKVIRDLWDNKSRSALVIMSIAIGVISFAGLLIARTEITANLFDEFDAANAYDIAIDLPKFDDTLVRWAASLPNVTGAQGITVRQRAEHVRLYPVAQRDGLFRVGA